MRTSHGRMPDSQCGMKEIWKQNTPLPPGKEAELWKRGIDEQEIRRGSKMVSQAEESSHGADGTLPSEEKGLPPPGPVLGTFPRAISIFTSTLENLTSELF